MKRTLLALLLVALVPDQFAVAEAPYAFSFPRDHAAHRSYQSEWWHYAGRLRATDGRVFDYQFTFFRFALQPDKTMHVPAGNWHDRQVYAATFAVTDEASKHFGHADRFARESLGLGAAGAGRLSLHIGDWSVEGQALHDRRFENVNVRASGGGAAIDLVETPEKPPSIHGVMGVLRKGSCATCAAHAYSYTRLRSQGALTLAGRTVSVRGLSWMDHEFGSDQIQADQAGWDTFSIQLDDGRDLMLFLIRRRDGSFAPESSGTLVEADGSAIHLPRQGFSIVNWGNAHWRSPNTGAIYPSLWEIALPSAGLLLSVSPVIGDQELVATAHGASYWSGAVDVEERATGGKRVGSGYVELTGYASPLAQ